MGSKYRAPAAATKFGTSRTELSQTIARLEPPPLYPQLEIVPEPLDFGQTIADIVEIEENLVKLYNDSNDFLVQQPQKSDTYQRKQVASRPSAIDLPISLFPSELIAKKNPKKEENDELIKLKLIDELDDKNLKDGDDEGESAEDEDKEDDDLENEDEEEEEENEDEAGGDYADTYFDNGEDFEDNDDDGDDGPIVK